MEYSILKYIFKVELFHMLVWKSHKTSPSVISTSHQPCFKSVFFLLFQVGIHIGWGSPNVARFSSGESTIQMTLNEISWMVSVSGIGNLMGCISFSIALEYIGGRRVILVLYIIFSLSWICLIAADSVVWIYVARLVIGIAVMGVYTCFSIFLGEVAKPKIRGTLISIAAGGSCLGILFGLTMETYITSMKVTSSIYLVLCVLSIILFMWLRDSPYYFAKKGDFESAKRSIAFYFTTCDVEELLVPVKAFVEADPNKNIKDKIREFYSPATKKSIFIIFILFGLPHFAGYVNLMSYMETILESANSHLINPQEFVIYANVISIIATLLTVRISDKLGRRVALILSSTGTSIAMICLGFHFYLLKEKVDVQSLQWLPILSIIFYLVFFSIGYATIPSTLLSELFPENLKSFAACFATFSAAIVCFAVNKVFQPVIDTFGEEYIFWIHAALSSLSIPYALFLLPETKGKTLQQIQNDLMKG